MPDFTWCTFICLKVDPDQSFYKMNFSFHEVQ